MPEKPDLNQILIKNPNVNAEQLKARLEAGQKRTRVRSRYRYNLLAPFGVTTRRNTSARAKKSAEERAERGEK